LVNTNTGRGEKQAGSTQHRDKLKQVLANAPTLAKKVWPLLKGSLLLASSLASILTTYLEANNTANTRLFNMPKSELHGAMSENSLLTRHLLLQVIFLKLEEGTQLHRRSGQYQDYK